MLPHTEDALSKIYDASKHMLEIVNDVFDISKIEAGKMTLVNKEYDTEQLISYLAQLHMLYAGQKNVNFRLNIDENLPATLIGDALRLRQILSNLLTNAFKYTESGEVVLSLHCEKRENEQVMLVASVKDTGKGMTEAQIHTLKGEYVRLHEQEMPYVSGTGLGIPIVYQLTQFLGAQFDLVSTPGKGTKATVHLPQAVSGTAVLGHELADKIQSFKTRSSVLNPTEDVQQFPQGRVLVVDDIEINLFVAEAMLESFGLTVECCESGQEAIDYCKSGKKYDIIFMDHMMPDLDGIETTKILRAMGYHHPIVALTANAIKGQPEMFIASGFSGFMTKPIDVAILHSYVIRFVSL
jgi:CheY-like chemotaxis protein